jgi:16S rRNA (guanine(966)-N(2))-methyltransferase RsmD
VRIVGGEHKGRIIDVGRDFNARPTTDFAREALFNILSNHFDFKEISFLDLFSGSGSISFECCSRGCREIDLVEINSRFVQHILKVASKINMSGIHPIHMDVFRFLKLCRRQYDLIFADPPYEMNNLADLPGAVMEKDLLLPGGWFILEHSRKHNFKEVPHYFDERKYGNVHFSFFRK